MIRVKDKDASLNFYQDVMGMKLKRTSENPSASFNLYFLGYGADAPETLVHYPEYPKQSQAKQNESRASLGSSAKPYPEEPDSH